MLKSIYSSKLYIASSRKTKIHAALLSKGNYGLVQQLASDLDEEYKTPDNLGMPQKEEPKSETKDDELMVNESINPETDLMTVDDLGKNISHGSKSSGQPAKFTENMGEDKPEPESHSDADTSELMPESPANEKPAKGEEQPAEASTKITSTTIIKPEQLVNIDVLKGTLNAREDLAGVARVAVKEKEQEIWIYYNDNVNLNNIMVDVIEFVKNAGFDVLEFNRLARSDNAIVFSISFQTVTKPDKSIEEAAKEEK